MLKSLFILLVLLLLHGCTSYKKLPLFPDQFDSEQTLKVWEKLLLSKEEFPQESSTADVLHHSFLDHYKKSNPGFVNLDLFKKARKKHPLTHLKRWYHALFYFKESAVTYMVMQFPDVDSAKSYLPRLRSKKPHKAVKILRIGSIVVTFYGLDSRQKLLDNNRTRPCVNWIYEQSDTIMERL